MSFERNDFARDDGKKWKPRNKQTAFVIRPAQWINQPPTEPKILPSLAEQVASFQAECRHKVREIQSNLPPLKPAPKVQPIIRSSWAGKYLRRLAKSKGLPPPTPAEIEAFKRGQPHYGEPK